MVLVFLLLDRYRDIHGISSKEHKELLEEYEWGEEEFEAGFQKGVAPRDGSKHFLAYEALVRRELAKGEVRPCLDKGGALQAADTLTVPRRGMANGVD